MALLTLQFTGLSDLIFKRQRMKGRHNALIANLAFQFNFPQVLIPLASEELAKGWTQWYVISFNNNTTY